jgi:hypothetical protein
MVDGKENDNDTWIAFFNYAGKLLKSNGIAYVRLDHIGKNAGAGARGGSAKKSDVDLVWYMTNTSENTFKLSNEKSRVPLERQAFIITRNLDPLSHVIKGGLGVIDWAAIVEMITKHEKLVNFI